jgi:L-fuconolactonase
MVDTHVHLWNYDAASFPWMSDAQVVLKRDFLPADFLAASNGTHVSSVIAVQARQVEAESDFLLSLADAHPFIRGVVGWVDLRAELDTLNARLAHLSAHSRFRGVRHVVHDEQDDNFMLLPEFQRGIGALEGHNLAYDLLIFPRHLAPALQLVRTFPSQTFVLDHIANPQIGDPLEPWLSNLKNLAECPNVSVKLSGMVTKSKPQWDVNDFSPYIDGVFEAFGPDRVMVGSDWPVALCNAESYASTMNVVIEWLKSKSADVSEKILRTNAERIYKLHPSAGGAGSASANL